VDEHTATFSPQAKAMAYCPNIVNLAHAIYKQGLHNQSTSRNAAIEMQPEAQASGISLLNEIWVPRPNKFGRAQIPYPGFLCNNLLHLLLCKIQ
jgi:hypothetical protein